ncbi:MAG: hypothetical protein IKS54_06440 [Erysipelotrichaceae bacterium]|nr:hypothetical protein [Erysipelotrichaceae bacterium]
MKTTTIQTVTVKKSYTPDESIVYEIADIDELEDSDFAWDISVDFDDDADIADIAQILISFSELMNWPISKLIRLVIYMIQAHLYGDIEDLDETLWQHLDEMLQRNK